MPSRRRNPTVIRLSNRRLKCARCRQPLPARFDDDPWEALTRNVWFNREFRRTSSNLPPPVGFYFSRSGSVESNFFDNSPLPARRHNTLQLKLTGASTELADLRFNTIGVVGFFDVQKIYLVSNKEPKTPARHWRWGMGPGPYLFYRYCRRYGRMAWASLDLAMTPIRILSPGG